MKYLKTINELYNSPKLTDNDILEIISYLDDYANANGYDIYRPKSMDISRLLPDETETRINNNDPYGEEEWEVPKPKLMSSFLFLFEDDSKNAKKILSFSWMTNGIRCTNDLHIDDSNFKNIDIDLLKNLVN